MKQLTLLALFAFSLFSSFAQEQEYYPDPDPRIRERIDEWQDLKFGLLMHWGAYSQWGVVESWSICPEDVGWATGARKKPYGDNYFDYVKKYEALQNTFNPTQFSPEKWAAAARDAGMKYVVFTTKHHDGFCMFDTKYSDYKITDPKTPFSTNPRSNVTKEIFNAFRQDGFWIGAYFSKPDWHSDYYWWKKYPPADRNANYPINKYPEQWKKFVDYTHNQVNELMSDYGKIDILWLDGGWVQKRTQESLKKELLDTMEGYRYARIPQSQDIDMPRLVKEVREKQPELIVVDRAVPGQQQNYLTPEQHIPEEGLPYPWETCMTMAGSWSYVPGDVYKPTDELVEKLVDIVSKGGNFLLNIGPSPEGNFDDTAYARLKDIGSWMKVNGSAIYSTRPYKTFHDGERIRFTQSKDGRTKYIFLMDAPTNEIEIHKMEIAKGAKISLLSTGKKLKWKSSGTATKISLPRNTAASGNYVWVLKVEE